MENGAHARFGDNNSEEINNFQFDISNFHFTIALAESLIC